MTNIRNDAALTDWPQNGLESVKECPVCGGTRRRFLYDKLRDTVFFCAAGHWTLHACLDCHSAYLDPRPTADTLYLAYRTYYTHSEPGTSANLHGLRYLRRLLSNGYKNWRFGANLNPTSGLGVPFFFLMPFKRTAIAREYRHLPRKANNRRLLDVGFGDGEFLHAAHRAGWDVTGVDTDLKVVMNARNRGLNVHQGDLQVFSAESNIFDVITLSHVVEHASEPMSVLRDCLRLLKPGGKIWLETPNINSIGRLRFQRHWRGLETPRHLVLFNWQSLHAALNDVGFTDVKDAAQPNPCFFIYSSSARIQHGLDPYEQKRVSPLLRIEIMLAGFLEMWLTSRREFISVTATKADV